MSDTVNGWWDHVSHDRIDNDFYNLVTIASGLFYSSAKSGVKVHSFDVSTENFKGDDQGSALKSVIDTMAKLGLPQLHEQFFPNGKGKDHINLLFADKNNAVQFSFSHVKAGVYCRVRAYFTDAKLMHALITIIDKQFEFSPEEPDLFILTEDTDGRAQLQSIGKPGSVIKRTNYSDKVLEGFDYVCKQLSEKEPFGRLVILHGSPGTGKTHLMKSFVYDLNFENVTYIFLQPDFLSKMNPTVLTKVILDTCEENKSIVLLIEDADQCLVPRQGDNISALSSLLNLADGFIGNMLDVRIIASTNSNHLDIDDALKRPGRLCRIIEVDKLSVDKANELYHILSGKNEKPFDIPVVLAEVYAKFHSANANSIDSHKIGFGK